jgi:hypothetical protein
VNNENSQNVANDSQNVTSANDYVPKLYDDLWSVNLVVSQNVRLNVKIDTQAQCNVMGVHTYEKLLSHNIPMKTRPSKGVLNVYGGGRIVPEMEVLITCSHKDVTAELIFQVVDAHKTPTLLGDADSVKLNLIKRIYSLANDVSVDSHDVDDSGSFARTKSQLLEQYADVFSGVGTIPGEYHIDIDPEVQPVVHPPRSVPVALRSKVKAELDKLQDLGIIESITEPTEWVNSLMVVSKGDKVRICIDPKDLNRAVKRSHFPLNTIEKVVTNIGDSKVFGKLDCKQGFFQIALTPDSRKLTCFNTPWGRYVYRKLPMGLASSPEIYQQAMMDIFGHIPGVEVIMDDLLLHAKDLPSLTKLFHKVLKTCQDVNLKLNPEKIDIATSLPWVGHEVKAAGLKVSDDKV